MMSIFKKRKIEKLKEAIKFSRKQQEYYWNDICKYTGEGNGKMAEMATRLWADENKTEDDLCRRLKELEG